MFNKENCTLCTACGSCRQLRTADTPVLFCMHCQPPSKAPCLLNCSVGAIEILGGSVTINFSKCTLCRDCVEVCPINVINI